MRYVQLVAAGVRRWMLQVTPRRVVRSMTVVMAGLLFGFPLFAQQGVTVESTPGTLASVPVPPQWQVEYDPFVDSTVLFEPGHNQVVLFGWYAMDPAVALTNLLVELGGQYVRDIRPVRFAGHDGAEVRIDAGGGALDWILALERDGILLGVWARTAGTLDELSPVLAAIVSGTTVAPAQRPPNVAGHYQTGSTYSGGVTGHVHAESYVTLRPNGSVVSSGTVAGSTPGVTILDQSRNEGARWEVRGDRLLIVTEDGSLINKRLEGVYSNGLSFYGAHAGARLEHWVRQ